MPVDFRIKANSVRQDIIKMLRRSGKGHTAPNLGTADIFSALYFGTLKHDPRQANWQERDRVFAAKQYAPVWRTTLAHSGYFAKKDLFQGDQHSLSGSLAVAVGSALASQMDGKKHQLANLTLIIDRGNLQSDGYSENVMPLEPLREKLESFSWNVIEVDGHNHQHIIEAANEAKTVSKPTAILAHTIPGKGVSFIENNTEWYEKTPSAEE